MEWTFPRPITSAKAPRLSQPVTHMYINETVECLIHLRTLVNMETATVCFIAFWTFFAFSEAVNGCPPIACVDILYAPSCRSVSFTLDGKDQVCQDCDMCVEKTKQLDGEGCPLRVCNMMAIPKHCKRDVYYVYQGSTICKDCPRDICNY